MSHHHADLQWLLDQDELTVTPSPVAEESGEIWDVWTPDGWACTASAAQLRTAAASTDIYDRHTGRGVHPLTLAAPAQNGEPHERHRSRRHPCRNPLAPDSPGRPATREVRVLAGARNSHQRRESHMTIDAGRQLDTPGLLCGEAGAA